MANKNENMIQITNEDNMILMARYPDNYFDLAIVDPPYGVGMDGKNNWSGSKHEKKDWDNEAPSIDYFKELKRVSKNQIIWGANHFIENIQQSNSSCWLIWDKKNDGFSFADAEIAWTSFSTAIRFFRYHRGQQTDKRIHPTQKPYALYEWILKNYAKENDKILDTHLGSGSIAIAIDNVNKIEKMNLTLTACELDKDYYNTAMKRINEQTNWQCLF